MTEEDREFVELTAELTARKVVEDMMGKFKHELPCIRHDKMIQENRMILQNGLRDSVDHLDETLAEHIKTHEDDRRYRNRARLKFYMMFSIGVATTYGAVMLAEAIRRLF